jgi:hypothetical protein
LIGAESRHSSKTKVADSIFIFQTRLISLKFDKWVRSNGQNSVDGRLLGPVIGFKEGV